jgi:hypothetical protein
MRRIAKPWGSQGSRIVSIIKPRLVILKETGFYEIEP